MGAEAYVTGEKAKQMLEEHDQVIVPPGQFAQLITEEQVRIPADALALISIKSKFKFWGLINVSGFHVDPGFDGKLIFSVYNAGVQDIVITRTTRIFLIWFAAMDQPSSELYDGKHAGQAHIPDEEMMKIRGTIPSLAVSGCGRSRRFRFDRRRTGGPHRHRIAHASRNRSSRAREVAALLGAASPDTAFARAATWAIRGTVALFRVVASPANTGRCRGRLARAAGCAT